MTDCLSALSSVEQSDELMASQMAEQMVDMKVKLMDCPLAACLAE